jgi:HAD superfamily phosphoserine phosphatase-like hydrolase
MNGIKAVILDIDGTVSAEHSWLALTRDLGADPDAHVRLYMAYRDGSATYEQSRDGLLELWRSTGNAKKEDFERIFAGLAFDQSAISVVDKLRQQYHLCLITGSMDLNARSVATRLGIDDWYANTTLHWDVDGNLSGMDYELDQASRKLQHLEMFCKANGYLTTECVAVGDGENDLGLFRVTGHGILIAKEHDPTLAAAAQTVISDLSELPAVLGM